MVLPAPLPPLCLPRDFPLFNLPVYTGEDPAQLALRFEESFKRDMTVLGVRPPLTYMRVSDHIPHIIQYIELIEAQV